MTNEDYPVEFTEFRDITPIDVAAGLVGAVTGGFAAHEIIASADSPYNNAIEKVSKLEQHGRQIVAVQADIGQHASTAVQMFFNKDIQHNANKIYLAVSNEPQPYTLQFEEVAYIGSMTFSTVALACASRGIRRLLWKRHNNKIYEIDKEMSKKTLKDIKSLDLTHHRNCSAD